MKMPQALNEKLAVAQRLDRGIDVSIRREDEIVGHSSMTPKSFCSKGCKGSAG